MFKNEFTKGKKRSTALFIQEGDKITSYLNNGGMSKRWDTTKPNQLKGFFYELLLLKELGFDLDFKED